MWPVLISSLVIALLSNPWEEVGWRGFALPRLQSRYNALIATLIVGLLWGLWHLPLFWWVENPMSAYPFMPWLISVVAEAVIYTCLYNGSGGSLLIVSLYHIASNTLGPVLAGSVTSLTAVHSLIAIISIFVFGPRLLSDQQPDS